MLVLLNGSPGVGKLTVGRELSSVIGARLLDVHTVYNLSLALTAHKSDDFYGTIRAVWSLADGLIAKLPPEQPVVFTEALASGSDWAAETWARYQRLAAERGPLCVVHLRCDVDENARRIASPDRDAKRKPRDPDYARSWHAKDRPLMGHEAERLLELDTTNSSPTEVAERIAMWIKDQ